MRLPVWLHNLTHGGIPRLRSNPYLPYDGMMAPKYFMWELYCEVISMTNDERSYLIGAMDFIKNNGKIVEGYVSIEEEIGEEDHDKLIGKIFMGTQGSNLYLYKDNLIRCKVDDAQVDDAQVVTLEFYYPVSKQCVIEEFKKWIIVKKGESRVSILTVRNGGLSAQKVSFSPPVISDLELNYGAGFNKTYKKMVDKLNENGSFMFLYHGDPGSGKSYLIKHLTSVIDREFIFIPSSCFGQLSSPDFISLLLTKKEAVLILEDAEQAIQARGGNGNDSAVSTLLNLSDGVLGNVLNIGLILSYNCDKQLVDKAILRKGRLSQEVFFGPLKTEDAQRLMKHLGKDVKVTKPMTLADIYGVEIDTGSIPQQEKQMGFHTLVKEKSVQTSV